MGVPQMQLLSQHTPYVSGLGRDGIGGDPSPKTAYGVFLGLKAAVQERLGVEHLYGVKVAVQGLGSVGLSLCHWLARAGADLVVADISRQRVEMAVHKYDAHVVSTAQIGLADVDVFAPCALGGVVTQELAERMPARVVAGAANNQLADVQAGQILFDRGVLYAPDFVINAGGVISVAHEYLTQTGLLGSKAAETPESWVGDRINAIPARLAVIIEKSQHQGCSTDVVARDLARDVIEGRIDQAMLAA